MFDKFGKVDFTVVSISNPVANGACVIRKLVGPRAPLAEYKNPLCLGNRHLATISSNKMKTTFLLLTFFQMTQALPRMPSPTFLDAISKSISETLFQTRLLASMDMSDIMSYDDLPQYSFGKR